MTAAHAPTPTRQNRRAGQAPGPTGVWLPQPRAHVDSNVTRLLCAGVHVDTRFCNQVIEELLKQRHRCAAPSYGYDTVAVLAHALNARRRRRIRALAMLGCLLPLVLSVVFTGMLSVTLVLTALWWAWMVVFVERLVCAQTLITRLKRPVTTDGATRGHAPSRQITVPWHPLLPGRLPDIVTDQNRPGVYYSGYVPFVGAGTLSRNWSFSVILRQAFGQQPGRRFTVDQLLAHVHKEVLEKLRTKAIPGEHIEGLKVERRMYRTALTDSDAPLPPFFRGAGDQYDSAREYLCINIGSWEEELVTSIFVGFDVRGDTLHTELHSYVLLPIKASFHEVDRLPAELTVSDTIMMAISSPMTAVASGFRALAGKIRQLRPHREGVVRAGAAATVASVIVAFSLLPWTLFLLVYWLNLDIEALWFIGMSVVGLWAALFAGRVAWTAYRRTKADTERARRQRQTELAGSQGAKIVDRGARTSIRDLAASAAPHHFFQRVDQDKYTKIIERRVTDFVIDFLRGHSVDVSEFETRQAAVLNFGIMQTGSGQIISGGTMAAGVANTVTP